MSCGEWYSSSPLFNETFTVNRLTLIDDNRKMHSYKLPFIHHEAKRCKTNAATIIITKCYLYRFGRLIRGIRVENAHDSGSIWQIPSDKCLTLEMRSVRIAHKRNVYTLECESVSTKIRKRERRKSSANFPSEWIPCACALLECV